MRKLDNIILTIDSFIQLIYNKMEPVNQVGIVADALQRKLTLVVSTVNSNTFLYVAL